MAAVAAFSFSFHTAAAVGQDRDSAAIMFWNLENYFDPFDDPETNDDDFTPGGVKHWTWKRFTRKRNAIAKVLLASATECGDWPAIIGFAEVENKMVLRQLLQETPLAKLDYDIIHRDSPDRRGIDVAAIYRKSRFKPVKVNTITIDCDPPTRDILYVKGVFLDNCTSAEDTLHLFVNHWPSKLGGVSASRPRRQAAADALKRAIDSLQASQKTPLIIATGDFNDTPDGEPIQFVSQNTVNLAAPLAEKGLGTIRYNGNWELIDQFIVSSTLIAPSMIIHTPAYLLERDTKYLGFKPRRTYIGPRHNGGISDHLPIILKIFTTFASQNVIQ
jgi:Predicted extracellular nuclease